MYNTQDIEKTITIKYDSLDTLLERKESMLRTLDNYLNRTKEYEFISDEIVVKENKYVLNLKIRLR